jgi:hypothetical protein
MMARSSFLRCALLDATALTIIGRLTMSCQTKVLGTKDLGSARWYTMTIGGSPAMIGGKYCSSRLGFSPCLDWWQGKVKGQPTTKLKGLSWLGD